MCILSIKCKPMVRYEETLLCCVTHTIPFVLRTWMIPQSVLHIEERCEMSPIKNILEFYIRYRLATWFSMESLQWSMRRKCWILGSMDQPMPRNITSPFSSQVRPVCATLTKLWHKNHKPLQWERCDRAVGVSFWVRSETSFELLGVGGKILMCEREVGDRRASRKILISKKKMKATQMSIIVLRYRMLFVYLVNKRFTGWILSVFFVVLLQLSFACCDKWNKVMGEVVPSIDLWKNN